MWGLGVLIMAKWAGGTIYVCIEGMRCLKCVGSKISDEPLQAWCKRGTSVMRVHASCNPCIRFTTPKRGAIPEH